MKTMVIKVADLVQITVKPGQNTECICIGKKTQLIRNRRW